MGVAALRPMPPRPIHLELAIVYRELDGSRRERQITVKQFQLEGAGGAAILSAHCSLSGAFTAFEAERIEGCIDLVSGETVQDLPALLLERYDLSRAGRLEALERELAAELVVLLRVGRADGLFQQREKDLIATYLCRRQSELQVAPSVSVAELASHLRWIQAPTPEQFTAALEQLARAGDQEELLSLYALCEQLADVRPGRDGEEQPALSQLQAHWFPAG
jgi:hypothetical protein